MIDVQVSIAGILMCCDETVLGLSLGNGYVIEKVYLDELPFKNKITNGEGHLNTAYFGSRLNDENGCYFMCIKKEETFQIAGPQSNGNTLILTDQTLSCDAELSAYMDREMDYLNERINLCRIFKSGNIGFRDVFFIHKFQALGIINYTLNHTSHNETRNVIDSRRFSLPNNEPAELNQWISDYSGNAYSLLKECIDEFSWGLEQLDIPTAFEQYTTTLEMTLLPQNQPGKKQMLANRIPAMLGTNKTNIQQLHSQILDFYRYRSESLHDGNGSNITDVELKEMESIARQVLKKFLICSKTELTSNPNITWTELKNIVMQKLVDKVRKLKQTGDLV